MVWFRTLTLTFAPILTLCLCVLPSRQSSQLLLDSKADASRQGKDGFSALIWAARKGFDPTVKVLLDAGADVNAINTDNNNALHGAAGKGHDITIEVCAWLH